MRGGRAFRLERRGLPTATPPWIRLSSRQLHAGVPLRPVLQQARQEDAAVTTRNYGSRQRRYALHLPTTTRKGWGTSSTAAMNSVFGDDELGEATTILFQSATTKGTGKNYTSNLKSFFEFCAISLLDPKKVSPIDIARYITWLGKRGTMAATSLQPCLSSINKFMQDHALPPVALAPLVSGVRKGLENCQENMDPLPQRLPLPALVALEILELAESLQLSVQFY